MASDREHQDDNRKDQVSDLLATIVTGGQEARTLACESLSRLLVSMRAVVALLREEREVGQDSVFLVSLRLDAARTAVSLAAVELSVRMDAGQRDLELHAWADWFIRRVDELSLGASGLGRQPRTGSVLHLFDAGHYRRGQRHPLEEQVIALFDEAAVRPDEMLRERAFERLWNWASQLAFSRCHDPHVADDVATEAVLSLLRNARAVRVADHPFSGVDVARRVRTTILGSHHTRGSRWRGLVARVAARRELPFQDVNIREDDVPSVLDDHTTSVSQGLNDSLATSSDISELLHQTMRDHLDQCREHVLETTARQKRGEQAQRALEAVVDVLAGRVTAAQRGGQRAASFVVAQIITHWIVEPNQALPALRQCLQIQRPRWIKRRLWHIKDQLLITGLLDRHLAPRAARPEDVRSMLEDLEGRRRLSEFIGQRRQQQTILGVVTFWRACLEQLEAAIQPREVAIKLPPLFQANQLLRVSPDVLDAIAKRLGISGNAAHNSIKRQLSLLTSWGMVEELEDIKASDRATPAVADHGGKLG